MPMREMLFRAAALALCLFAAPAFAAMPDAAVTRAPAGDGKTLVRGRGVQGLCPPGWSGKEDDQWHGLRFTSADGKEYIMARALNFPMYDVPHYPLVMEWARGMGAKNVRSVEGLVEFTDKNGNKVVIAGYGADLPAVWMEYRDNPAAPDQGVGFSDMLGSIRADAETGARAEVPLHDGYAEDVSAEGDCWRVTAELAAFRAAPGAKARLWELLPKGSVLYKAEPAGKGQWIGAGEIDARGDGPAYVYRLYEGDRGYVRAADVQRTFCSAKRPRGESAMSDAAFLELCAKGTAEQVMAALRQGAKVNVLVDLQEEDDMTPLMSAAVVGNLPVARALLAAGADVNAKNPFGLTALMFATRAEGGEAVARALLEAGADVNAKAENGLTALMEASRYGTSADVRAMLAAGADVNARAGDGRTALLHATMYNRDAAVVRALLEAGADKAPTDYEGHDALWHARKFKNGEIIRLLEGGAAKPAANAPKPPTKYVGGIGPYPVTLFLDVRARVGEKAGHYFYDHRPDSVFSLEMVQNEGDPEGFQEVILHEYTPRGMQSGVFTGRVATRGDGFSGAFVNSRGQSFPFELREAEDQPCSPQLAPTGRPSQPTENTP